MHHTIHKTLQSERFVKILAATWLTYATYSMLRRPLSIVRGKMIADSDMSLQESGAIDTAFLIFYTLGQLYYSTIRQQLFGRLTSRRILTLGLAGSAICVGAFGLVPSGGHFGASSLFRCLLWAALGLVQAVGWASCLVVLTPWIAPSERGKIMGLWGTNMAIGGVLGNTVSSAVLSWTGGSWVSVFLIVAGFASVVAFSLPFWLGPHPNSLGILTAAQQAKIDEIRQGSSIEAASQSDYAEEALYNDRHVDVEGEWIFQKQQASSNSSKVSPTSTTMFDENNNNNNNHGNVNNSGSKDQSHHHQQQALLLSQHVSKVPGVLGIAISYFFHKLVRYVMMLWMPFYLSQQLKLDPASAGYMSTSFDVGGIFGTIGSGFLADYIGGGNRKALTVTSFAVGMAVTLFGFGSGINTPLPPPINNGEHSSSLSSHGQLTFDFSTSVTFVLCFLAGAFSFGIDSLMTGSLLQDHCEKMGVSTRIGAIGAFVGAIGTLGSILQGPFTVVLAGYSWNTLFMVMVLLTSVAIGALMPVVRTEMSMTKST